MQSYKLRLNQWVLVIFIILSLGCQGHCFLSRNKEAKSEEKMQTASTPSFKMGEKFFYRVRFNGVKVGKIEFEYKGQEKVGKDLQDILVVNSDVKILGLFEIESREKIYVDRDTHLPLKVEREVKFLGRQESILEEYSQKEGWLKITKEKGKTTEERLIKVNPPIHNVLILYFLYPLDLKDKTIGKTFEFNLPLRKVSIKVKEKRKISTDEGLEEVYLLEGSPRRFKLWLKKKERLPMRVEIPAFLGRVVITRV